MRSKMILMILNRFLFHEYKYIFTRNRIRFTAFCHIKETDHFFVVAVLNNLIKLFRRRNDGEIILLSIMNLLKK